MRSFLSVVQCALIVGFSACSQSAAGDWEGVCELSGSGAEFSWEVEIDIQEVKGVIDGDVDITVDMVGTTQTYGTYYYYGYEYTYYEDTLKGDVDGTRDGDVVELEMDVEGTIIDLLGVLDGDRISGDCTVTDDGVNLGGDFVLTRY